jgi:hypothetical protein
LISKVTLKLLEKKQEKIKKRQSYTNKLTRIYECNLNIVIEFLKINKNLKKYGSNSKNIKETLNYILYRKSNAKL